MHLQDEWRKVQFFSGLLPVMLVYMAEMERMTDYSSVNACQRSGYEAKIFPSSGELLETKSTFIPCRELLIHQTKT